LGPKITRAKKNKKIVSEKLMPIIILPEKQKRQCGRNIAVTKRCRLFRGNVFNRKKPK